MTFVHWLMKKQDSRDLRCFFLFLGQYMHKNYNNEVHKSWILCKLENEDACPRVTVVTVQRPASLHYFTAWTACDCKLLLLCCSASRSNYLKKKKKNQLCFVSTCQAAQRTMCRPVDWEFCGTINLLNSAWWLKEWTETASSAVWVLAPDCVFDFCLSDILGYLTFECLFKKKMFMSSKHFENRQLWPSRRHSQLSQGQLRRVYLFT